MEKQQDAMVILKLYELRRDEQMRAARQWYFSQVRADVGDGHRRAVPRRRTGECQFPHGHVVLGHGRGDRFERRRRPQDVPRRGDGAHFRLLESGGIFARGPRDVPRARLFAQPRNARPLDTRCRAKDRRPQTSRRALDAGRRPTPKLPERNGLRHKNIFFLFFF